MHKPFPPSSTSLIKSVFIICSLEMLMTKSIIIVKALYHCSVPTHPLAHPVDVYQEATCQEGNQLWGLHNSRSQSIKKAFVPFRRGGEVEQKQCLFACVMRTALREIAADQPMTVGGAQTFNANQLPIRKDSQEMNPPP